MKKGFRIVIPKEEIIKERTRIRFRIPSVRVIENKKKKCRVNEKARFLKMWKEGYL